MVYSEDMRNFEFNIQLIHDQIFWNFDTSDATGGEIGSESATSQPMRINFSQSATSQNPNEQPDKPEYPSLALSIQRYDSKMRLLSAHYKMSLFRQCLWTYMKWRKPGRLVKAPKTLPALSRFCLKDKTFHLIWKCNIFTSLGKRGARIQNLCQKVNFLCILSPNDKWVFSLKCFTTIIPKSETPTFDKHINYEENTF